MLLSLSCCCSSGCRSQTQHELNVRFGSKADIAGRRKAVHFHPMWQLSITIPLILGAGVLASCNRQRVFDFCEVVQQGPELAGSIVKMHAWHGSAGFWGALGSGECGELIQPDFSGSFDVTTTASQNVETSKLVKLLQEKPAINVPFDFSADFEGVLKKRAGYHPTQPVPLHAPPPLNEMPYVLHVTGIKNLRIVGHAPWKALPPPPPRAENG